MEPWTVFPRSWVAATRPVPRKLPILRISSLALCVPAAAPWGLVCSASPQLASCLARALETVNGPALQSKPLLGPGTLDPLHSPSLFSAISLGGAAVFLGSLAGV